MTRPLRIAVGGDAFLTREGLLHALGRLTGVEVVGAAGDLAALHEVVDREHPDVVITDTRLPPSRTDEGIRLAVDLAVSQPRTGVIVLFERANRSHAIDLFAASPRRGYMARDGIADEHQLAEAIDSVRSGWPLLDASLVELVIDASQQTTPSLQNLPPRELRVLALIANGLSNDAIAKELTLTRRAVERRVNSIFRTLRLAESTDVNRRVLAAVLYARLAEPRP